MASARGTVICTGTNGGLGSAFVKAFASSPEGSRYCGIYTVRNPSTAHDLNTALKRTPASHESEVLGLDLGSLKNIRAAADSINARVASGQIGPIRALVLNAAFQEANSETMKPKSYTEDGFEMNFGVNYLANFLFVLLLLKSMDKAHGRIVLVSSWTHDSYDTRNDGISIYEEKYKVMFSNAEELSKGIVYKDDGYKGGMRRYGASKLALVMFLHELQRRVDATPELSHISVLALDPAAMGATSLTRHSPAIIRFMTGWIIWALQGIWVRIAPNGFIRPTWKSANDVMLACFETQYLGDEPKAVYLDGSKRADSSIESRDETKQRALWEDTVKMVGLKGGDTPLAKL